MLAGNLHVERHGVLVGVDLQHTHLGAVLADVEREVDQTRFVLLDEGAELLEFCLKSSSLPSFTLCVPIKMNGSAITMPPFPRSPPERLATIVARATRMALLRRMRFYPVR
jgi:hypothetical protein